MSRPLYNEPVSYYVMHVFEPPFCETGLEEYSSPERGNGLNNNHGVALS